MSELPKVFDDIARALAEDQAALEALLDSMERFRQKSANLLEELNREIEGGGE